jgi:hypothetical protein
VDPNNWVLNKVGSITTAAPDINVSHELILFPNPSSGTLYIKYPAAWFDQYRIYDMSGKLLQSKVISRSSTQQTINKSLSKGVYFLQLNGKGRVAIKKFVIIY